MIKVSQEVYNGLEACRNSGKHNMFNRSDVALWCLENGWPDAHQWVSENKHRYIDGIFEGFEVDE